MASKSLDPDDWASFRAEAHEALDSILNDLETIEERPVWQPMSASARETIERDMPRDGRAFSDVLGDYQSSIAPYVTGNRHPAFMGWVHGAGTPVGMIGEMLAAGLNANCGGRDHVGIEVENQITRWAADVFRFPDTASGLFVTGTSMANLLCLLVARTRCLGADVRRAGLRPMSAQLTAYTSAAAHSCIEQAMEMAGIGADNLRLVDMNDAEQMSPDALRDAIAQDKAAGHLPCMVIATAGSVNTGAIDPLADLAAVAREHDVWFHVDGAFGALAALSPSLAPKIAGIELADSIAFDFHKWAHVPYDAGFLLVRDGAAHKQTFASPAAYLQRSAGGLGAGATWPCDLGPDLSRGFRALKTWFTLQTLGADRIGDSIENSCAVARHLAARLQAAGMFEVLNDVTLNIVCWRVAGDGRDELNEKIVIELHERGLAAPSMTTVAGRPAIRAAIVNHRTTEQHMDHFVADLTDITARHLATDTPGA